MKSILVLILGFTTALAYADGVSLLCDAKTQVPPNKIVTGKVSVSVAGTIAQPQPNRYFFEPGYTYSVAWENGGGPDLSCGRAGVESKC